eukprot:gene31152-38495_t
MALLSSSVIQASNYTNPKPLTLARTATYGVLASSTITNAGPTVINGDLGLFPGSAVTGAPQVLGQYLVTSPLADLAQGDLLTAIVGSSVVMLNRAENTTLDNIFWNIGTVSRIKTSAVVLGTVLSWQGIAVGLGAVTGPLFSKNAAVTLLANTVTARILPANNHRVLNVDGLEGAPLGSSGSVALVCLVLLVSVTAAAYYHIVLMAGAKSVVGSVQNLLVGVKAETMERDDFAQTYETMV